MSWRSFQVLDEFEQHRFDSWDDLHVSDYTNLDSKGVHLAKITIEKQQCTL